jgi:hypothetical protein
MRRFTPRRSGRGTGAYEYFELALALGPQAIGVTGDNRYETLYGREYLLVWDLEDDMVKLYRERPGEGQGWDRITDGLPPQIFDNPLPDDARHITFAFDQSARMIFAYEQGSQIFITRWDATINAYVQNVSFAGVDPCVLMDATLVDPRGYPNLADDGWGVREAYYAGIRVLFEWLAETPPTFRDNPITDSDIVLFYLTPDRAQVHARVQRELFATVNPIYAFAEPIVMDRAIALAGRYQLLISDEAGDVRTNMLISDPYIGDFIINPQQDDVLPVTLSPEDELRIDQWILVRSSSDTLAPSLQPEESVRMDTVIVIRDSADTLAAMLAPEGELRIDSNVAIRDSSDGIEVGMQPEDSVEIELVLFKTTSEEALDVSITPEPAIRIQRV